MLFNVCYYSESFIFREDLKPRLDFLITMVRSLPSSETSRIASPSCSTIVRMLLADSRSSVNIFKVSPGFILSNATLVLSWGYGQIVLLTSNTLSSDKYSARLIPSNQFIEMSISSYIDRNPM